MASRTRAVVPPYTLFAPYYDEVYEGIVDYPGDVAFLEDVFRTHGKREVRRVLDLGCGTGTHALHLGREGYEVDAVDVSLDLLDVAWTKLAAAEGLAETVRFHEADMAAWLPEGPFDAAISMFGAFNYLVDDEDVAGLLDLLRHRVRLGGLLVFELWNPLGVDPGRRWDRTATEDGRTIVRLSETTYETATGVLDLEVEVLVLGEDAVEARFTEDHRLRTRTPAEARGLLERHGFEVAAFTEAGVEGKSLEAPAHDAFRVMVVARRV